MKILLLYFTGTYSTLYITTLIKNQLINLNHEVDVFSLAETVAPIKEVKRINIASIKLTNLSNLFFI